MDTEMARAGLPITIGLLPGLGSARVFGALKVSRSFVAAATGCIDASPKAAASSTDRTVFSIGNLLGRARPQAPPPE